MDPVPATIGKYRIRCELGQGATGTVYLGYDAFRDQRVAVKQIHPHLMADPAQARRHRQLLLQRGGAGPSSTRTLVRVIDVDEQADPPYLVLEYVQGTPLSSLPPRRHPAARAAGAGHRVPGAATHWNCRTARPGASRHQAGNLLLPETARSSPPTSAPRCRCAATRPPAGPDRLAGLRIAPEQVKEEAVTHHADMFSLAVVIYELLCGQQPFEATPTSPRALQGSAPTAGIAASASRVELPGARWTPRSPARWEEAGGPLPDLGRVRRRPIDGGAPRCRDPTRGGKGSEARAVRRAARRYGLRRLPDVALWQTLRLGKRHELPKGSVLMREDALGQSFSR